ncbi:hypothetical protein [Streptomyces flaveolus]
MDFIAGLDDADYLPVSGITSASDFEAWMHQWVARFFGACVGAQ